MAPFDKKNKELLAEVLDWSESVMFAVTVAILILVFVFKNVGVYGSSMENTFSQGDRVIISNLFYNPQQFDVVVINKPNYENKPFIKRIIATEGQTVDIDMTTGQVVVDGEYLVESYVREPIYGHVYDEMEFPTVVPPGCIFVMGDNRNESTDSRSNLLGFVDERYIMGKVLFRIYPLNSFGFV